MPKLGVGMQAIDFTFDTPWSENKMLSEMYRNKKTILMFLRYYGCRVCQLDMSKITKEYEKFSNNNAQVLIVLQTEPALIREQEEAEDIPFTIICDPEHIFYKLYSVGFSTQNVKSGEVMKKVDEAIENGIVKVGNNGKEIEKQLPATFILDTNGNIEYVHYGTHSADVPSVDELIVLLSPDSKVKKLP